MRIRTTRNRNNKKISNTLFESPSYNLKRISIHSKVFRGKVYCSQVSNGNSNRLDHESFYHRNIERLLHFKPADCENELKRLEKTTNKSTNRKLVIYQVFSVSAHQAELKKYQGHIKLDNKNPFPGTHGLLTYDLHDRNWIPHIGIVNPSNCKAETKKDFRKNCFSIGNFNKQSTVNTRFKRRHKSMSSKNSYLAKLTKLVAILPHEHKQPTFDSRKTHVPHFKLQKFTPECLNFIKNTLLNQSLLKK